ncbi:MAG: prepilin-type N-terminal cleavage/methylation domain-containing protein [Novosphingobium sp.]|nr:prepilin-type N-terminal cleavage/methylation domain-containing protein [Novosphingobium sp.]
MKPAAALPAPGEAGFSLVEALVALAITAAAVTTFLTTLGQDAQLENAASLRSVAVMVARSALDRALGGDDTPSGSDQGFGWQVARQPRGLADPLDRVPLEDIVVTAGRDGKTLVTLKSVRVRP